MSSVALLSPSASSLLPRKRTSSFSYQLLPKVPRIAAMGALRRTESCLALELDVPPPARRVQQQDPRPLRRQHAQDNLTPPPVRTAMPPQQQTTATTPSQPPRPRPSARSRAPKSSKRSSSGAPQKAPAQVVMPSATSPHAVALLTTLRTTSPLSPVRAARPGRPIFPRSKTEPDLYKKALLSRMKQTEEGKRIVCMGPRLAISIWTATRELARIVEDQERREREREGDVVMGEEEGPVGSSSWVVVKPGEDWEMVDCAA